MAKKEKKSDKPFKVQRWKKKSEEENPVRKEWGSVPATAFKTEEELKAKVKRGSYEEKVAVDISFEDLIKLSVTDIDKPKQK
jgi:hypothetical protein